jgi:hypothetical protein
MKQGRRLQSAITVKKMVAKKYPQAQSTEEYNNEDIQAL